ncbi:MAG: cytochrome P450 [Edaphobacter sp.]
MNLIENLKGALEKMEASGSFQLAHLEADVMEMLERIKQHALDNPEPVFAVLRRIKPVLIVKNIAVVTRFDDVQDVLVRDDVFQVTYGEKMRVVTGGNDFFLGMQNSPEYERDTAHMRSVIRRSDVTGIIVPFVADSAKSIVDSAGGGLDVVSQLGLVVPTRLVGTYFGTKPVSEADVASWASTIFQYLFTDLNNDPAVDAAARDASARTRAWLDEVIKAVKGQDKSQQGDTVLTRCLALQAAGLPGMTDVDIRNNLLGLLVGAIPTTSKCCAQALDELLKRPAELAKAQVAARTGDDAMLAQYVWEALRFHPNNPGVFRVAAQEYVVGKGQIHATRIPVGTSVLAATQSAMFDERVVEFSKEFRIGRPAYNYMHWGVGLHTCFGQYINQVQIPGILKPLLQRSNLRRADGDAGTLKYAGPFPSSLTVQFD